MTTQAPTKTEHVSDVVHEYARDVMAGRYIVGKWVRLACERHLDDLEHAGNRGIWWNAEEADDVLQFFGFLRHSKGEWAGKALQLEPWQSFIIGSVFGWYRDDGTRRFRDAYNEICRKNGKSTIAAGVGLYLAFFDNEPGAEVYSAATKRDQAKIVWGEAKRMVGGSPLIRQSGIRSLSNNLNDPASNSKFEPLGADDDSMDGLNIHGCIVDELHAHKNRKVWDVLDTAMGSRRQPLTFVITTAGFDRNSVCWEQHDYAEKVLDGTVHDDGFFAFIASIDQGDDWTDPSVWPKANPNLGVSVKPDYIAAKVEKAKQVPGQVNAVRRLHMGEWTESASRWLNIEAWDEAGEPFDADELEGEDCYVALDLSSRLDTTSAAAWFPAQKKLLIWYWVPEEGIEERTLRDRVPYQRWIDEGYIEATDGNAVDYDTIRTRMGEIAARFHILKVGIDPWNAQQLSTQLAGDGFDIVEVRQGYASLSDASKELEKLVVERKARHGGNPVLRWQASNVVIQTDAAGNIKPAKDKSRERIDGVVAFIMAIFLSLRDVDSGPSVYEERGMIEL